MSRLTLASFIATLTIAVTASVFAIWPAVANAPWEDDAPAVVVDGTDTLRCDGALSFRDSIIRAGEYSVGPRFGVVQGIGAPLVGNPGGVQNYDAQLAKAEREIDRYC